MFDHVARSAKDHILRPVIAALPRSVTPTMITIASLPFGLASATLAAAGAWRGALFLFIANRILDGLDGLLARARGEQSDLGGYLDIMVDFVVYAAIPTGVWFGVGRTPAWPLIALLATFYINGASWMYLSAVIEKRRTASIGPASTATNPSRPQTSVTMPTGIVEGTETVIFYLAFLIFPHWWIVLFTAMVILTAVGIVQRILWAYHHV